ncbi:MAG: hypothetical protein HY671_05905 [Chloroflexi bacterium]|nr:hypothetical protein [Chloroflexota bacterium]
MPEFAPPFSLGFPPSKRLRWRSVSRFRRSGPTPAGTDARISANYFLGSTLTGTGAIRGCPPNTLASDATIRLSLFM